MNRRGQRFHVWNVIEGDLIVYDERWNSRQPAADFAQFGVPYHPLSGANIHHFPSEFTGFEFRLYLLQYGDGEVAQKAPFLFGHDFNPYLTTVISHCGFPRLFSLI
jgi:hypothetical protein